MVYVFILNPLTAPLCQLYELFIGSTEVSLLVLID